MATAEQMQEALQQIQVLTARMAALETQLQFESARAQKAEQERSTLIQSVGAMRTDRGGAMVDTKGIGQPFMLKGTADQDFGEWTHKVRTFMLARFGDQILTALSWAARQRKIVVKTCVASQRNRMIPWIDVFGEGADEEDQIDEIDDFVVKLYAYFVSFTSDAANRIVRNSGEGNGLEAWRRLHSEYHPTSSMRRVAILQQVQNPSRCQRVEDLGSALEDWLSKKRQYEMFTDRNGRPCQASDDSLVAAMFRLMPKSLEETVMFANEDEGFQELCDRLLAYSSTKQSIQMSENKKTTKNDDSMDVDALSKGKSKGKGKKGSSGKGKGSKGQNNTSNVVCWYCGRYGHYEKDCRQKWWSRGKGWSETGAQGDEHADGWTWSGEHVDGLWKTSDWQTGTGPGWWTTANDWTPWESEEPVGGFEINGTERCWSKTPEGAQNKE